MTDKLHVAVDLDDVTVDFFQGVIDAIHQEFGVQIPKDRCTSWDDNPVKTFDWKAYGYDSWWDWMKERDWLWATFKAVPGAIGGVHRLRSEGHYVELLTSKPEWAEWCVWRWLGRWRPAFNRVTIVDLTVGKFVASEAHILVDDKDDNCFQWVRSRPDRQAVVFDQPWNRLVLGSRIQRAHNWHDVIDAVENVGVLA